MDELPVAPFSASDPREPRALEIGDQLRIFRGTGRV